jgi:hypothetical protein
MSTHLGTHFNEAWSDPNCPIEREGDEVVQRAVRTSHTPVAVGQITASDRRTNSVNSGSTWAGKLRPPCSSTKRTRNVSRCARSTQLTTLRDGSRRTMSVAIGPNAIGLYSSAPR